MTTTKIPAEFLEAISGSEITDGGIDTADIADSGITTAKIANNAITAAKLPDNVITATHIPDGLITGTHLANSTVTQAKIADNSIGTDQLAGIARGKIIYGDSNGDPQLLTIGSNGTVLKSDGTDISWGTISSYADSDVESYLDGGTSTPTFASVVVDDITLNGSTISDSGDLTLDVGGDIILDADGGDFRFKDAGTQRFILDLDDSAGSVILRSNTDDGDLIFQGSDGGTNITALTLDISDAGTAIFNHDITLPDDGQAIFGAGSDLKIKHDGTDSYIQNYTGNLEITNNSDDKDIVLKSDDGSGGLAQYIRLDGSAGLTQFDKDTKHVDSKKATFGDGGDLQLYHSGTNSIIDNNTGGLYIRNNVASDVGGDIFIQAKSGENSATFTHDGAVTLMYDNATKFATSSSGVTVSGTLNVTGDGDDILINSDDYELFLLGNRGASGANLDKAYLRMKSEGTNTIALDTAGDSYFNGGNVGIGTSSPTTLTELRGTIPTLTLSSSESKTWSIGDDIAKISFFSRDGSGIGAHETGFILNESENSGASLSGALVFGVADYNTAAAEAMRIDSDGNVGIGDATPEALLDVGGGYGSNTTVATFAHATDAYIEIENMTTQNGAGIILTNAGTKKWTIQKDTSAHSLHIQDTSGDVMTFLQGGNVGIGTTTPATTLHMDASGGAVLRMQRTSANASNKLELSHDGTDGTITSTNNLLLGSRVGINRTPGVANSKLEVGGADNVPLINVEASGATAGIGIGSSAMKFYYGTSEKMKINTNGQITAPSQPAFDAGRNAGYQSDDNDFVQDAVRTNVGSHYNSSNGRFTAPVAGQYLFSFRIFTHDSGGVVQAEVCLRKNGADHHIFRAHKVGAYHTPIQGTKIITLAANDYVNTYVKDSGTSSGWMGSAGEYNYFCGTLLS